MTRLGIAGVATLLTMGVMDVVWLVTMTPRLYRRQIPDLLLDSPQWVPALAFYLLYAVAVLVLVVRPAIDGEWGLLRLMASGALLGLAAYGTYDLTNQATLRGWSALVTIVDMAWGASLTATVATAATLVARRLG
ncbi:MAG: DUF2177 family protein [Chloroflexi bacterium]|nr:DUF2177 family protein [Chloroflexota bacterium]